MYLIGSESVCVIRYVPRFHSADHGDEMSLVSVSAVLVGFMLGESPIVEIVINVMVCLLFTFFSSFIR